MDERLAAASTTTRRRSHAIPIDDPPRREARPGAERAAHAGHGQADRGHDPQGPARHHRRPASDRRRRACAPARRPAVDHRWTVHRTKEVIGGYAILEAKSMREAVELTQ